MKLGEVVVRNFTKFHYILMKNIIGSFISNTFNGQSVPQGQVNWALMHIAQSQFCRVLYKSNKLVIRNNGWILLNVETMPKILRYLITSKLLLSNVRFSALFRRLEESTQYCILWLDEVHLKKFQKSQIVRSILLITRGTKGVDIKIHQNRNHTYLKPINS